MKARLILPALLLAIAVIAYVSVNRHPTTAGSADNGGHAGEDSLSSDTHEEDGVKESAGINGIETTIAAVGEGWDAVYATGIIAVPQDRLVKVCPRIGGRVVWARGAPGDFVSRGQALATISSLELAEARAQYRQARSRLAAAEESLAQESRLAKLGGNTERPVEEARAENLAAQGELADAKSELAQAKSELAREEVELAQCGARLQRAKGLYVDQIISRQDLESAEAELKRDSAAVDAARSRVEQAESKVEKAKSKLEIASRYLSREETINKSKVHDLRVLQSANAAVTSARLEVQAAADRIRVLGANPSGSGDTISVTSPISGRIVLRNTNVGEMASASDELFVVANLERVWVEADVFEKDLAKVTRGQRVEVRVDAYPDRVFGGKIESIGDILSRESRTAKVRCSVSNTDSLLRAEMFASVSIITATRGSTVLVPRESVLDEAGRKIVFTPCVDCPEDVKAGTSVCGSYDKLEVVTGPARGNLVEVVSGLEPGTTVVTKGAFQLKTALGSGRLHAGCSD